MRQVTTGHEPTPSRVAYVLPRMFTAPVIRERYPGSQMVQRIGLISIIFRHLSQATVVIHIRLT
jgi:hypothetical protein